MSEAVLYEGRLLLSSFFYIFFLAAYGQLAVATEEVDVFQLEIADDFVSGAWWHHLIHTPTLVVSFQQALTLPFKTRIVYLLRSTRTELYGVHTFAAIATRASSSSAIAIVQEAF